jgi:DNA repair protein RadA/Sms
MVEVTNPSEMFLSARTSGVPGSIISVIMEGTRPILFETQGLTAPQPFGNPRCVSNGVDRNRLQMIVAVLTRRVGLKLGDQDVILNIAGVCV